VGRSAEPKGAVAAQNERRQKPRISPRGSEGQIQSRAEASLTICEIDSYLPLQGCAGLHLCCQNWGLGTGYLPTPPEREEPVSVRAWPFGRLLPRISGERLDNLLLRFLELLAK